MTTNPYSLGGEMNLRRTEIYIITGPPGVGKSTIAGMVANRLDNSAFIEGDMIYHMVAGGFVSPWEDDGLYLELFWENVLDITANFIQRNISVVLEYIIFPEQLNMIANRFGKEGIKIKYIVLMAGEDTILKRDNSRELDCRMGEKTLDMLDQFRKLNIDKKYILDTSNLNEEDTLNIIMAENRFELYIKLG